MILITPVCEFLMATTLHLGGHPQLHRKLNTSQRTKNITFIFFILLNVESINAQLSRISYLTHFYILNGSNGFRHLEIS